MLGGILVIAPFGKVWAPFIFQNHRQKDGPEMIGREFTLLCNVSIGVALAVSIAAPIVIPLLAGKAEYHEAATSRLVPILCLALTFFGLASASEVGILIKKKTHLKPKLVIPAIIASLVLNVSLVPVLREYGAALATLAAYFVLFLTNFTVSRRFYRFRLETGEMLCSFLGAGVIYGLFATLYQVFPLAWKPLSAGVFLLFPAAVALRWRRRRVFGSPVEEVEEIRA